MHIFIQDIKYGIRMLLKNPAITLIAIITLGLGIGANTAIFNVVNSVLLKPLSYTESDRLMWLTENGSNGADISVAYPNFEDWKARNQVFEKIGAYRRTYLRLLTDAQPEQLYVGQVSADLFDVLRVSPILGRVFSNDEDKPGANPVVVLGHSIWKQLYNGDASIIGRSITLDDQKYTIIGVMSQQFQFPERVEMWVPAGHLMANESWRNRNNHGFLYAVGRLKPGVTLEQAREDLKTISLALAKQYPASNQGNSAVVTPLLERYVGNARQTIYILMGAVGFVLLIACANVANLTLARSVARRREIALRAALGASRNRIIRQLLTEYSLLAFIGGGIGLIFSRWCISIVLAFSSEEAIPRVSEISIDGNVLLYVVGLSILCNIIFGLFPAMQITRVDVNDVINGTNQNTIGGTHGNMRNLMVVTQVALTLVLLVGAGLLIHSFYRLQSVNPGFNSKNTLSFAMALSETDYPATDPDKRINAYNQLKEKIKTIPGVESVSLTSRLPLGVSAWRTQFTVVGRPDPPIAQTPKMDASVVDLDYFRAMQIPLLRGRLFNEQDNRSHLSSVDNSHRTPEDRIYRGAKSVIVDEEFARRYWPNEDAIGRQIRWGRNDEPDSIILNVIGVTKRVHMDGVRTNSDLVQVYFPLQQLPDRLRLFCVVRSTIDPEILMSSVRNQIKSVDSTIPIYRVRMMEDIRSESVAPDRLNLMLLGIFAGISLILAMIGIYGVLSWSVTQRIREIGLRMALGASMRNVLALVIGGGMKLIGIGIAFGLIGAFLLTRLMRSLLFEVSATDPITFIFITILLVVTAILACWIPARRATKVDPISALRSE